MVRRWCRGGRGGAGAVAVWSLMLELALRAALELALGSTWRSMRLPPEHGRGPSSRLDLRARLDLGLRPGLGLEPGPCGGSGPGLPSGSGCLCGCSPGAGWSGGAWSRSRWFSWSRPSSPRSTSGRGAPSRCGHLKWCGPWARTGERARAGRRRRDHPSPRGILWAWRVRLVRPVLVPVPSSWWMSAARCGSRVFGGCRPVLGWLMPSGRPAGCARARTPRDSTARGCSSTVSRWWSERLRLSPGRVRRAVRVPWAPAEPPRGCRRSGRPQHGHAGTTGHLARCRSRTRPAHHRLPHSARRLPLGRRTP